MQNGVMSNPMPIFRRVFRVKKAIFETNPTSPVALSLGRQNYDFRNEPNFALLTVTPASKKRLTKRTQLRPSRCHTGLKKATYETNPAPPFALSREIDRTNRRKPAMVTIE